jgi:predicted nuclease with TOPRIM domain
MDDRRFERLESIMERGFATLADLQRETNTRLDETNTRLGETNTRLGETNTRLGETNTRLGRLETKVEVLTERVDHLTDRVDVLTGRVDVLTGRVGVIEHVLVDLASQLVDQGRLLRVIADRHDGAIDEIKRRLDAVERRLPPEKH